MLIKNSTQFIYPLFLEGGSFGGMDYILLYLVFEPSISPKVTPPVIMERQKVSVYTV